MFVAEFLCCPLEAIITVLIIYTPIYAKKFLKIQSEKKFRIRIEKCSGHSVGCFYFLEGHKGLSWEKEYDS